MPEDLWRFEEKEYNGPSGRKRRKFRVFARYLTEHDLDKLKLRAKRVRKLTITIRESISESLKRLSTIQAAITFPDFPVFTNLRTLEVKAADDWVKSADKTQDISYLRILAGPSLRQLRFDIPLDSPENVSILTALPRQCKNVTELKLGPAMSSGPFSSVVLDRALGHWDQLQEIYVETIHSLGHLVTLSHLPRLRTLELEMGLLQDVSASGPSGGFRSLTRLKVFVLGQDSGTEPLLRLLGHLFHSPLSDLEFYIQSNSRDDRDLPLILKRLSQVINSKTLERLSIGVWTQGMDPAVGLSDDPYHLDALQPFCNVHALRIWMPRATPLPPLLSLGRAIRGIRSLDLGPEPAVHISPRLDIRDLVPIARSFPKLKTLALPALDAPAHTSIRN
ncbi:hypothetical protein CC1G_04995 [Coprinopsis cinerea okayama7|uniref:F-box domain-containing protein n=1 Tax=Coprinopsis cinerea (strain Okayama-7 / 130 / ATCC MYA-4618 / FGSC 9003) TaxID=240176 RepID=A8NSF8_COPC7|nr:hypothetical protein CC1G_04995 [Coprinopsis cinerea okayama7\|eukprot:XP_001836002.2 hypothetical protein CC1G_04995 [Coprinopsis cinerea okayama7\